MQRVLDSQAREAEVYKRELTAWYKTQRKEQEASRMTEEQTAKEKYKVVHMLRVIIILRLQSIRNEQDFHVADKIYSRMAF